MILSKISPSPHQTVHTASYPLRLITSSCSFEKEEVLRPSCPSSFLCFFHQSYHRGLSRRLFAFATFGCRKPGSKGHTEVTYTERIFLPSTPFSPLGNKNEAADWKNRLRRLGAGLRRRINEPGPPLLHLCRHMRCDFTAACLPLRRGRRLPMSPMTSLIDVFDWTGPRRPYSKDGVSSGSD